MSTDAEDGSNDGKWQREAARALGLVLRTTDFVGGILLAITPAGRVVPVIAAPGDATNADIAAILRGALEYVEAGRVHREPNS